jgi:hypothetical protein
MAAGHSGGLSGFSLALCSSRNEAGLSASAGIGLQDGMTHPCHLSITHPSFSLWSSSLAHVVPFSSYLRESRCTWAAREPSVGSWTLWDSMSTKHAEYKATQRHHPFSRALWPWVDKTSWTLSSTMAVAPSQLLTKVSSRQESDISLLSFPWGWNHSHSLCLLCPQGHAGYMEPSSLCVSISAPMKHTDRSMGNIRQEVVWWGDRAWEMGIQMHSVDQQEQGILSFLVYSQKPQF